jgi:hypothetical protein
VRSPAVMMPGSSLRESARIKDLGLAHWETSQQFSMLVTEMLRDLEQPEDESIYTVSTVVSGISAISEDPLPKTFPPQTAGLMQPPQRRPAGAWIGRSGAGSGPGRKCSDS